MGLRANPTQRQRRLGLELRRLRNECGLSAAEAGAFAGLGSPHLGHIEAGRTAIPEVKLRALLAAYGCCNETLIHGLVAMSESTGKGWWSDYRKSPLADSIRDLAELESTAVAHRSFQWMYVPGLLQTPEYVRALIAGGEVDADLSLRETYVEFRLKRQQVLTGESPPAFHAVIHEAAFHMQFVDTEIMRGQIEHLVEMARLPHVRIQLLPFKSSLSPATPAAPFVLLEAEAAELNTVYVQHPVPSTFLEDQAHLAQYGADFERLSAAALPPIDPGPERQSYKRSDSLRLVQHLLYTL
ncbi:helix-turn-helix transcriptional regulator [Streptomyces sp. NPDC005970]|uniref:helix-turn-helix domain-containing protein n=1 Tax=Streptomyces sp. NPDC005970 TaxID=3156723 RepID=UPI003403F1E6